MSLARPTAVLFDVGDTLLHERWFNLEAGVGTLVSEELARSFAEAFRVETARCYDRHAELLFARWLQQRISESLERMHSVDIGTPSYDATVIIAQLREARHRCAGASSARVRRDAVVAADADSEVLV